MKMIKVNIDQMGLEIWAHQTAIHKLSLNIDQSRQIDRLQAFDREDRRIQKLDTYIDIQINRKRNRKIDVGNMHHLNTILRYSGMKRLGL